METTALSLLKGSSSWAREDQPSSRRRHLLRPEKMTLSGVAKCEYGLGGGVKGCWLIRDPLIKEKIFWIWGNCHHGDLQSRCICGTARVVCVPPSLPACACPCSRGPACCLPACTRIPGSSGASWSACSSGLCTSGLCTCAFSPPKILVFLSDCLTASGLSLPACKLSLSSSWVERVV